MSYVSFCRLFISSNNWKGFGIVMNIWSYIYQLFITPLQLLLEIVYGTSMRLSHNQGLSIVFMSLVMNLLLLPLYNQADAIQAQERDIEKKMEPWVKHIRKTFKGDERFMMLQTYYNQNHYKTYYTLRSSLPLALEVPFFIAAYHFLSNLKELHGGILGPIQDLGAPDHLLVIGSLSLNALPIIMTLINIVSSSIYTKGFAFKDKLTLYGMAMIFLVLLYDSPSGLVFYWTMNNLFSLVKNLFYKLSDPKDVLIRLASCSGAVLLIYSAFFYQTSSLKRRFLLLVIAVLMELPILLRLLSKQKGVRPTISYLQGKPNARLFFLGALFLSVVTGVLIPSAVIVSSPDEFIQLYDIYSPTWHIVFSALSAVGTFVIWSGIFYYLFQNRSRKVFEGVIWFFSGLSIILNSEKFYSALMSALPPSPVELHSGKWLPIWFVSQKKEYSSPR